MSAEASVLVVANLTSTSRDLTEALRERTSSGPCRFTLLLPAKSTGHESERLEEALSRMRSEGLRVDEGLIGDSDPLTAVKDVWAPDRFDEIVVSTLPPGTSDWLENDVPRRLEQETSVRVTHVAAHGSDWSTFDRPSQPA